ncbi:hypothetical protein, partial [Endozoicomonas atrinae]|uniref:hypothetical protein n=1 Tax=Endozoicomonas atrinae TaxID=1333660 RepID=UPI001586C808
MPHTQRILNHVDEDLCLQLIAHTCIRKPVHIVSHEYPTTTRIDLEEQVRAFDKKQKRIFDDIAQRIDLMRDDVGQELLGKLVEDQFALQRQNGPFNQAAWAFLNEPAAFEQAENERFADTARYTNRWDSFRVLAPIDQVPDIDGLREHLVTHFGGKDKVLVELFERHRPCIDGTLEHLMQVMVYREGLPSLLKEVSEDKPVLKETMV